MLMLLPALGELTPGAATLCSRQSSYRGRANYSRWGSYSG